MPIAVPPIRSYVFSSSRRRSSGNSRVRRLVRTYVAMISVAAIMHTYTTQKVMMIQYTVEGMPELLYSSGCDSTAVASCPFSVCGLRDPTAQYAVEGHVLHVVLPSSSWYVPSVHGRHTNGETAPTAVEKVPAEQATQPEPGFSNVPAGHGTQSLYAWSYVVPAAHRLHPASDVSEPLQSWSAEIVYICTAFVKASDRLRSFHTTLPPKRKFVRFTKTLLPQYTGSGSGSSSVLPVSTSQAKNVFSRCGAKLFDMPPPAKNIRSPDPAAPISARMNARSLMPLGIALFSFFHVTVVFAFLVSSSQRSK
eukprot:PhM_4_TR7860/c0_g1_i1/m.66162